MTWSTDFRALLVADAGVAALAGTRISADGIEGGSRPFVVYAGTADHDATRTLNGTSGDVPTIITAECWGDTRAQAEALGDAVQAACDGADQYVTERATAFDGDLGLECDVLTIAWWA
jgi:hypothetical protein